MPTKYRSLSEARSTNFSITRSSAFTSSSLNTAQITVAGEITKYAVTKYRNKFEERVAKQLGPDFDYETLKLPYVTQHTYLPDFVDLERKVIVESKGHFPPADRAKMLAVKKQHSDWTFRLIFQNPAAKLNKKSKTTYSGWAEKHGFEWSTANK
jgi:hypothetical protein